MVAFKLGLQSGLSVGVLDRGPEGTGCRENEAIAGLS